MSNKFWALFLILSLATSQAQAIEYGGGSADVFILDEDDDSEGNIILQFGSALNKTIHWDTTDSKFVFSDTVNVGGAIEATNFCDENGNNCFTAAGVGTDNDNQTLGLAGTVVSISGGNSIDLASLDTNTTYTAGNGLNLAGTVFSSLLGSDVDSGEIVDGTIATADLANNAVDSSKIADSSITSADIFDGTIALADLANNSVNGAKIVDDSVTAAEIAADAVGSSEIANGAVTNDDLANDSVNGAKIIDNSVTAAELADNSVGSNEITADAVNSGKIADGSITADDLGSNSVDSDEIAADAVTSAELADNSVGTNEIANGSVANADLANNAVNSAKIADNSIVSADILNGTIEAGDLGGNSVTSAKIADGTIATGDLANDSVTTDKIGTAGAGDANRVLTTDGSGNPQWEVRTNFSGSTLTSANIFVGNASNVATGVSVSGDLTLDNTGSFQLVADSVTAAEIASNAVGSDEIAADAVTSSELANNSVGTNEIANGSVANVDLANNAVNSAKIADNSIVSADILNGTIEAGDLAADSVTSAKITDGAVASGDLANDAVTTDKIGTAGAGDADKVLTTDGSGNPQWEARAALIAAASNNDLDTDSWDIGTGTVGNFSQNGLASENVREWGVTPFNTRGILWKATPSGDGGADGGWNHNNIPIDPNKTYRLMVWIKKTGDTNGTTYLGAGTGGTATYNLDGSPNTNPYFWYGDLPELDKWYLVVGYLHANNDPDTTSYGGIYDGETGQKVINITDFKNGPTATVQTHRAYLFYNTNNTNRQFFWGPRYEEVNGKELPVEAFLPTSAGGGGGGSITQQEATINNGAEQTFTHAPDTDYERVIDLYYQDAETVQENSFWNVLASEEGQYVQENNAITDFTGDAIRLEPAGSYTPGTTNLSIGATAIGSDATRPYTNGNDNNTGTFWYNQGGGPSNGQWWGVDLGTPTTVMRAQINWFSTTYHATSMRIEGSNDGTNWNTVATVSPAGGNTTDETWDFAPATYQYWRFFCVTGNNATYFVLREGRFFEALGGGFNTTPAYAHTTAGKSFNTTSWSQINNIDLLNNEPANTTLRYLFSFDSRSTWYAFSGGSWVLRNLNDIETVGMTTADVEALTAANWNAANGLNSGTNQLDYAVSLQTTDTNATPVHTGIEINYGTQTFWQKATETTARVRLVSDTAISVLNLLGSPKLFKVNIILP